MQELQRTLTRIEAKLEEKPAIPPWVTLLALPIVSSALTVWVSLLAVDTDDRANHLKQIEVVHAVVKDLPNDDPEKTVLLISVLRPAFPKNDKYLKTLEDYASKVTRKKLEKAKAKGGLQGAAEFEEVNKTLSAANTPAARAITEEIRKTRVHIIVASDMPKESALEWRDRLRRAGYPGALAIETSKRFAVSLGEYEYSDAMTLLSNYVNSSPIYKNSRNSAYPESHKSHWRIVN